MKIAIIGGAGVRTPLLVNGLAGSDLPIDEIALFDIDRDRLAVIGSLARAFCPAVRVCDSAESAMTGARFIFTSIRVGGIAARARDEATAMAHGIVSQETVGPAGFAMAMRTVPAAVEYARLAARVAPDAWIVNFTNPVGIVTQAMLDAGAARVIGICDTPTELFEATANALALEPSRCFFDYFGLNHLGWLREVYADGAPRLAQLWEDGPRLARVYRVPLFDTASLQSLRLLPTEYVFYYYRPRDAFENLRRHGETRGSVIEALNDRLFRDLVTAGGDPRAIYHRYLAERSGGYMQLESGASTPTPAHDGASELAGYDRIALAVLRAVHGNANAIIPLNVRNRGALSALDPADVVEVPCVVNANGAHPLAVGDLPPRARDLVVQVREYERLTVRAAATRADADAVTALAANPLVRDRALAARLVAAMAL